MGYLHTATHRSGDVENTVRICSPTDDPDEVFGDWWFDNTRKDSETRWTNEWETEAISLDSVREVPDDEYEVLSKYLPEFGDE